SVCDDPSYSATLNVKILFQGTYVDSSKRLGGPWQRHQVPLLTLWLFLWMLPRAWRTSFRMRRVHLAVGCARGKGRTFLPQRVAYRLASVIVILGGLSARKHASGSRSRLKSEGAVMEKARARHDWILANPWFWSLTGLSFVVLAWCLRGAADWSVLRWF